MTRVAIAVLAAAVLAWTAAATAVAAPVVSATASFTPDRLGAPTALEYSFQITDPSGALPTPLSSVTALLPAGSTIDTTGLATCPSLTALAAVGVSACPKQSFAGFGSAQAAAVLGGVPISETAALTVFLAPPSGGHTVLDFYADATTPILEQLAFTGAEAPASPPYGLQFVVDIPPIATVPGGPNVSITSLTSTIGAPNAAYYVTKRERVEVSVRSGGRTRKVSRTITRRVLQHVKGLVVPPHCPTGGFPFALQFSFQDGSTAMAPVTIPCPKP